MDIQNKIIKISSVSERLSELLKENHLTQTELAVRCQPLCDKFKTKIDRSYISKWVKGEYLPNQVRLTILGIILGVSELWLMGYDVDKERREVKTNTDKVIEKLLQLDMFDLGKLDNILDTMLNDSKYNDKK